MNNKKQTRPELNILDRFKTAPVGEKEIKMNLFNPNGRSTTQNLNTIKTIFEDDKYKVELKGIQLTQIHRDILDIFLNYGDNKLEKIANNGEASRLFSLYSIQNKLNYKIKYNNKWIEKKITEIQQSIFKITNKESGDWIQFSLIETAKYSNKLNKYAVILNNNYINFFNNEISIDYKFLLDDIVSLEHSQTKAIVRYLLTFKDGHQINIDKLLEKVGVKVGKRVFEKIRKKVIEELKQVGNKFNIQLIKTSNNKRLLSDYTVKYIRHPEIKIYYPN